MPAEEPPTSEVFASPPLRCVVEVRGKLPRGRWKRQTPIYHSDGSSSTAVSSPGVKFRLYCSSAAAQRRPPSPTASPSTRGSLTSGWPCRQDCHQTPPRQSASLCAVASQSPSLRPPPSQVRRSSQDMACIDDDDRVLLEMGLLESEQNGSEHVGVQTVLQLPYDLVGFVVRNWCSV